MTKRATKRATKRELEQRIAQLEEQKENLEEEVGEREWDNETFCQEVGSHFAALCSALDERLPFHTLPIRLRLDFEALAEHLGVTLPLRR